MKQKVLKTIYDIGGFKPFHFLNRNAALVLTYHRFFKEKNVLGVSADQFEEHLSYLSKNSNVISLDELVSCMSEDREIPPNAAVITIDDGYSDAYEIALPLLKKFGFPATLYVITDFLNGKQWLWTDLIRFLIDKTEKDEFAVKGRSFQGPVDTADERAELASQINGYLKRLSDEDKWAEIEEIFAGVGMTVPAAPVHGYDPISWDQAAELDANGVEIESHTVNHPILTNIDSDVLERELLESKKEIEARLNKEVNHFCYPNGTFADREAEAVKAAGYRSAVTTNYGFCKADADLLRIKRIDGQPSIANFAQSASGFEVVREKIGI